MPRAKSKATGTDPFAALLAELRESMDEKAETVPAGWLTVQQWADKWGYTRAHAGRLLAHGVSIGRMEFRKFRVGTPMRPAYAVVHYRPKSTNKRPTAGASG